MSLSQRIIMIVMIVGFALGYLYLVADAHYWLPWSEPAAWAPALEDATQTFLSKPPSRRLAAEEFGKLRPLITENPRFLRYLQEHASAATPNEAATAVIALLLVCDIGVAEMPAPVITEQLPGLQRAELVRQAKPFIATTDNQFPVWLKALAAGPLPPDVDDLETLRATLLPALRPSSAPAVPDSLAPLPATPD